MKKHTSGPWAFYEGIRSDVSLPRLEKTHRFVGVLNDANGMPIAECHLGAPTANAHLIAAAPDLLEALEEALIKLQYFGEKYGVLLSEIDVGIKAIAKAKGEL